MTAVLGRLRVDGPPDTTKTPADERPPALPEKPPSDQVRPEEREKLADRVRTIEQSVDALQESITELQDEQAAVTQRVTALQSELATSQGAAGNDTNTKSEPTSTADRASTGAFEFRTVVFPTEEDQLPQLAGVEKPYVQQLASGYAIELLVMDWLTDLVETQGKAATKRTLQRYVDAGWLAAGMKETLVSYVAGIEDCTEATTAELGLDEHLLNLGYLYWLGHTTEGEHNGI